MGRKSTQQQFEVVERIYPKTPNWEKRTIAYTTMVKVAMRIIERDGLEKSLAESEDDSGCETLVQAV